MRRSKKCTLFAVIAILFAFAATACSDPGAIVPDLTPDITGVLVSPGTASVEKGQQLNFIAAVTGNNASQTVIWSLYGERHTGTTINDEGRLTVSVNEAEVTLTVQAASTDDATQIGIAIVTVLPADPSVTTPPSLSATVGQILSELNLPNGWEWDNPEASVGSAGNRLHNATYNRPGNFLTVNRAITVNVTVPMKTSQLSAGGHSAVIINGALFTFGTNISGQIGNALSGAGLQERSPVHILPAVEWKHVTASSSHTHGIQADGSLWSWGSNASGELGLGDTVARNVPERVGLDYDWVMVSSVSTHAAAIRTDGSLWTWGSGANGRLGLGSTTAFNYPQRVGEDYDWRLVSAGGGHTVAIRADGTLWAWGLNSGANNTGVIGDGSAVDRHSPVQIGENTNWVYVSAGGVANMALRDDGSLWAWGRNGSGALGIGAALTDHRHTPVRVGTETWKHVSTSGSHTLAIRYDGSLWAWGNNTNNVLGDGSSTGNNQSTPVRIGNDYNWEYVSAGSGHSMAIRIDGTVWAWGSNWTGQLGDGSSIRNPPIPTRADTYTDWQLVILANGGGNHGGGIRSSTAAGPGALWTWGGNGNGRVGNGLIGTGHDDHVFDPFRIFDDLADWTHMSAGTAHTLAIRGGQLFAWGNPANGRLGNDSITGDVLTPTRIGTDSNWKQVAAGSEHSMAIRTDGTLWGWGHQNWGQLGNGLTAGNQTTPIQITIAGEDEHGGWEFVAAGTSFTIAIRNGQMFGWGLQSNGVIGNNSTAFAAQSTPVRIGIAYDDWTYVSTNDFHSMALRANGYLYAWGLGTFARLGFNHQNTVSSPTRVAADIGTGTWRHVSAGGSHTMAIHTDGSLWGWGNQGSGRLGNDVLSGNQVTPMRIGEDNNWAQVAAGASSSIALRTDNTRWGMGDNGQGRLGNGRVDRRFPGHVDLLP